MIAAGMLIWRGEPKREVRSNEKYELRITNYEVNEKYELRITNYEVKFTSGTRLRQGYAEAGLKSRAPKKNTGQGRWFMIKGKYSIDTRRMRAKIRQWERQVDAATLADLKLYGAEASKAMMKCTPPGNMKQTPGKALAELKKRIKQDFEGEGLKPFDDDDIFWYHDRYGTLRARIGGYTEQRPSPFRVVRGRPSRKTLAALNVGKQHKVEFVQDLPGFMAKSGQYYMGRRGSTYRLKWSGARHVTTMGAVRQEIRRRQHLAGKLMAGWKPLAHKAGTKLPAAVEKQSGKGSAKIKHSMLHKAVLEGRNSGHYPGLQKLVDRQIPWILKRNRAIAKKRAKQLGKKLKK